jgi:hypothetical protein
MGARQLILWHGQKTEWVVGSEVRLGGERKASEIVQGAEIVREGAVLIELGAHRRDGIIDAAVSPRFGASAAISSREAVSIGSSRLLSSASPSLMRPAS